MNDVLRSLLDRHDGVLTRAAATEVVPAWVLTHAASSGQLVRALPGVYADARLVDPGAAPVLARLPHRLRLRAALAWASGRAALAGPTALHVWAVRRQPDDEPVHLDVPAASGLRTRPSLVLHHRRGFRPESPDALLRDGLPAVRLERALVDAWPALPTADRPATLIRAVNDGLTTPGRVSVALAAAPRLAHRADLRELLDRLAAGCRSPLEVWGHDHVFTGPGMPRFRRQFRVGVEGRIMYLDVYAERERVDFELDGATTHGDPRQREVDLRRDALLATRGILVVRFAHRRLVHETAQVRREILAILATRRNHH
ncbi:endonuclease domain-containing protein [Micromonospora sp. NPDC048830]|uniref:endonuclease domain-containing protein n=1 Tax=Micromonospora sp. NPDC048830 TaxID=3364257 RepID=UPI00371773AD